MSAKKRPTRGGPGPRDLRVATVEVGGSRLTVVSFPLSPSSTRERLSPAETSVLERVVGGATNAQIARERGTSTRTVANQVASILRKVGAGSRRELFALAATTSAGDA